MGGLRSASWPGLGPGFGGVLGTWGHWPALPEPYYINGSPQTPRGLDPKAPSISRLTDPGIVGGGMGGSRKVVHGCTCGRTRVAAADLALQEGLGHSYPLWFSQCQVGLCVPCKGSDSGHGPGDRHEPPTQGPVTVLPGRRSVLWLGWWETWLMGPECQGAPGGAQESASPLPSSKSGWSFPGLPLLSAPPPSPP